MKRVFLFLGTALGLVSQTLRTGGPPIAGSQTPYNLYTAKFTPVYKFDPSSASAASVLQAPGVTITTDPAVVVGGASAVRLSGANAGFFLPPGDLQLLPNRVYIVSYQFRVVSGRSSTSAGGVIFSLPGVGNVPLGPSPLSLNEATGTTSAGLLLPALAGAGIGFYAANADIVIGDIQVFREDAQVSRASVPLWRQGYPRLALYNLTTPEDTAARTGLALSQVDDLLTRFDVLLGTDIDHTLGAGGWVARLRSLNPNLRILPYKNSFMADFSPLPIVGDSANLMGTFNRGVPSSWFMPTPTGQRLNEPDYPLLFQMDHTSYCPLVDGMTFTGYSRQFMSEAVLPSGLWDGVHFDQPEWYPNPLLVEKSLGPTAPLPAIDLTRTGSAAPVSLLYQAWNAAFFNYFQKMSSVFGYTKLMFGNPGYIPSNTKVLPLLNGWLREIVSPYTIQANGDWDTSGASEWYRLANNYLLAGTLARAPQMVTLQFTGRGLGTATGTLTANGLPDRSQTLETRDFQRMRLGLTTALLGNGFFDYALVDNTTAPVWFDEYSVNAHGVAIGDASNKGYLGQPLADAAELAYNFQPLLQVDFESSSSSPLVLGLNSRISTDPSEVISGSSSLVSTRGASDTSGLAFTTNPATLSLVSGKTYQLLVDYKILTYNPTVFQGFFGAGIYDPVTGLSDTGSDSLFQPDVVGPGQQGTLRASVKVANGGYAISGYLLDTGSIAIDNIRLLEATGGVWRRDFENGIVLVNPSPEAISVSAQDIAGPLKRTNIRRIVGKQSPSWNNGQPVTTLTIPSGDGIIVLADQMVEPKLAAPATFTTNSTANGLYLNWPRNSEYLAGYYVAYGEDPLELDRFAVTGALPGVELDDLQQGVAYGFRIAAYDFLGNIGPYSALQTFVAPGTPQNRPDFTLGWQTLALAPGSVASLSGSGLSRGIAKADPANFPVTLGSTSVLVNGVSAPLKSVSPNQIQFVTPWEASGETAVVQVVRNGISSPDHIAPLRSSAPILLTDDALNVQATSADGATAIGSENPAQPGQTVIVEVQGLGLVEPPPVDGALPAFPGSVVGTLQATVGGIAATAVSGTLSSSEVGVYLVTLTVPTNVGAGFESVVISSNGRNSNPGNLIVGAPPQ